MMKDEKAKLNLSLFAQMGFVIRRLKPMPGKIMADRKIVLARGHKNQRQSCAEMTSVYQTPDDTFIIRHEYTGSQLADEYNRISGGSNHSSEINTLTEYLAYLDERRRFTDPNPKELDDEFFIRHRFANRNESGIVWYKEIRIPSGHDGWSKLTSYETCKIYKSGGHYRAKIEDLENSDHPELRRVCNHMSEILVTTQDFYDYVNQQRAITR